MSGLALQVQETLGRDPHAGDLYVFRGARGNLIKVLWHDGLGMSLYARRLERGKFVWPSPANGVVGISCWVYVRDDAPFGGRTPPAAMFYYSRDRAGDHPQAHLANYTGILQANAYGGYNKLYEAAR